MIVRIRDFVSEYWFENLNLRESYKSVILGYMDEKYPELLGKYEDICLRKNMLYWVELSQVPDAYCRELGVNYINYFNHDKLRKEADVPFLQNKVIAFH